MPTERSSPRATSRDVAKLAGLSRTTISQILNGNDARFPQETRDRVAAAAAQLQYRPSRAGRALVSGVSDLIVIVVPNITFGTRLQQTIERFSAEAERLGLNAVVRYVGSDIGATLTTILDLRPAAVFHLSVFDRETIAELEAAGTPVLPRTSGDPGDSSSFDHLVGRMQAQELLKGPERRLLYAILADDRVGPFGIRRAEGVAEGAATAGAQAPEVVPVPLDPEGAVAALAPILQGIDGPVGIACYNDEVAIAVLAVVRRMGWSVPDQVAVVGVDRIDVGQLISPRLTTIAINLAGIDAQFVVELKRLLGRPESDLEADVSVATESLVALVPGESS
ncbi:LacI family transcriptional regulator [Rathayibacter sp. PhB93]|uniref:LacI family DNA-binding transcriptional regulator n=1 Tax=unclassified Rathayibacter TaxID=2609250 RepID=UPI000F9A5933|nr:MULTISPECIES: LacI family DNA-binding transcriptional regulator [unclassified Rathayibacter]ROQ00953.1 LacI family transcriptional regulator [Rathayibacter sp. PhB93]TDQ07307.1 LacI family transcriptional regulator [Rathayibacter sp. PhB1]